MSIDINSVRCQLSRQCVAQGLSIDTVPAERISRLWRYQGRTYKEPEEVALSFYRESGHDGTWCEGGTVNLLMKSACFTVLAQNNPFGNRQDTRRRYFEAQCTILKAQVSEILDAIAAATFEGISLAATEILGDPWVRDCYPHVRLEFLVRLWKTLGSAQLAEIARVFLLSPYDFRSGWPDLTPIGSDGVRFVEVKTTDLLHPSQLRIVEAFARPMRL